MTIGERIKFFRKSRGITQSQLAKLSGVHPVTVRKYETNKMVPQPEQIRRIADALAVSYYAIAGTESLGTLETNGDLVGFIIMLCKSGIIEFIGEKDERNRFNPETARIRINPIISGHFSAFDKDEKIEAKELSFKLEYASEWEDLVHWASIYFDCMETVDKYKDRENEPAIKAVNDEIKQGFELIEMKIQNSNILLDTTDGLKIKINHNYNL